MTLYKQAKQALVGDADKRIAPQTVASLKKHLAAGCSPVEAADAVRAEWKAEAQWHLERLGAIAPSSRSLYNGD